MKFFKRWKERRAFKVNHKRFLKLQQDLQKGMQILINIDNELKKNHTRKYRRRFWYDFYRNHMVRAEIFQKLLKKYEINIAILQQQIKPKKMLKAKKPAMPKVVDPAKMDHIEKGAAFGRAR